MNTPLDDLDDLYCVYFDNDAIKEKHGVTEKTAKKKYGNVKKALIELKQLKDAEEELEADFRILTKAKKNGIWRKMFGDTICYFDSCELSVYLDHIETDSGKQLYLCEYGDTWALTRKELE